jgi:hypothetical protein
VPRGRADPLHGCAPVVLLVHACVAMKPHDDRAPAKRIAEVSKTTSNAKEKPEAIEPVDVTLDSDGKLDRADHIILGED